MSISVLRVLSLCGLTLAVLAVPVATAHARTVDSKKLCSVTGVVTDDKGAPVAGALISILRDGKSKEVIATAKSDREGKFSAAKIIPGVYRLIAVAQGFQTAVSERAELLLERPAILNFALRPAVDPGKTTGIDPVKYQSRRNRTIFNAREKEGEAAGVASLFADTHGFVSFGSQSNVFAGAPMTAYTVEVTQPLSNSLEIGSAIQGDATGGMPQFIVGALRFRTDRHTVNSKLISERVGVASPLPAAGSFSRLTRTEVRVADTWAVSQALNLVYGFEYSRLEGASEATFLPRLTANWKPARSVNLHAAITSEGEPTPETSGEGGIAMISALPGPIRLVATEPENGNPVIERTLRAEIGAAWRVDSKTILEATVFRDRVDGRAVGLVLESAGTPLVFNQQGTNQGFRITLKHRLHRNITVTGGFASGRGQQVGIAQTNLGTPEVELFATRYHVLAVQADASLPQSGTRLTVQYRKSLGAPLLAIDPLRSRFWSPDAGLSVSLIQSLGGWGFMPGKWEVLFEGRNLADQADDLTTETGLFVRVPNRRVVRGGLRMRF
jgi:hypothetical protein